MLDPRLITLHCPSCAPGQPEVVQPVDSDRLGNYTCATCDQPIRCDQRGALVGWQHVVDGHPEGVPADQGVSRFLFLDGEVPVTPGPFPVVDVHCGSRWLHSPHFGQVELCEASGAGAGERRIAWCPGARVIRAYNVTRVLHRGGVTTRHAELFGRRPGLFVRQANEVSVRLAFDFDDPADSFEYLLVVVRVLRADGFVVSGARLRDDDAGMSGMYVLRGVADAPRRPRR